MSDLTTPAKTQLATRGLLGRPSEPMGWLRSEIDRLFDEFGRPARNAFDLGMRSIFPMPALEMIEKDDSYRLTAELPGLSEKDVEINVADGVLIVSGEKREASEKKDKGLMLSERRYGAFERQIALPKDVDPAAIKAQVKDGVLTVTLAKDKKVAANTRKIQVEKA
jgi:HSP20 family protein